MPDLAATITNLLPALNASSVDTLSFWTETELYSILDEAAKRLARRAGVWVEREAFWAVGVGTHTYNLPSAHVSVIHVSIGNRALKLASVADLEALDDSWPATAGNTSRYLLDAAGTATVRLYPTPAAGVSGNLGVIHQQHPGTIAKGAATISAPAPLEEYFAFSLLAEARGREGEAAMPEVAAKFSELAEMLEQVAEQYYGGSQ